MSRAIELAERGLGTTSPNPIVGCVIVDAAGVVVGEGFHRRAGEPHAEIFAIADAGGRARGATAFVTLEPCRHAGRTPPCTDALIDAGVARVVFAVPDPLRSPPAERLCWRPRESSSRAACSKLKPRDRTRPGCTG